MNRIGTVESSCVETLRRLDGYMDDQLEPVAALAVLHHLELCPSCAQELDVRRRLRSRLKSAVQSQMTPPYLGARIMANVRAQQRKPHWLQRLGWAGALAACFVVLFSGAIAYQLGHLRYTVNSQNAFVESIIQRVSSVMQPGLMDHVHCTVFRKWKKEPPPLETLTESIGPEYKALIDVVRAGVPPDYRMMIAHKCGFGGREFVHIAMKSDSKVVSLVLARKRPGETFANSGLAPVVRQAGIDLYSARAQRFQIAAFETRDHLAYVVSDLPATENRSVMLAIAPGVMDVLRALEG